MDKYAFEVEGCCLVYCWRGVDFENIHLATLKLSSFASIWNLFFKNMPTQPIFPQRVCMWVGKYAFEVEGYRLVYCWWGEDFENIYLATLKLRSFASIWNLFFNNMLTQPIFAQRVCMGVDKYAFEVEGCCLVYCWRGVDFKNIHLATLKLRQFGICFLKICWIKPIFAQRVCMGVDNYAFEVEGCCLVYCWRGVDFENIHLATLKLRQFGICFLKICWLKPIFAKRVCMGVDKYAFEVEGCCLVYCWRGVDFENIHLATLKLSSFASIWNLFFKNMPTQPIFPQRMCMWVGKYAFEVEGYRLVYCWWGEDFENIYLATLKLRSFASIWNLFFNNMLTQPIFAQRVCMGVDKYAFEVEGCCLVYCWWGVDFENIHLATLKLRQFGICFLKICWIKPIFAQRVCMGVDNYAFEVEGCCLVYCWRGVDFENIHLATLKLRQFGICFLKICWIKPIFAQRVCMGVEKYAFEVEGYCLVYCWWGVDFENIHLATLKLRQFGICFLKICWLSQFFLKECACEWANMHLRLKVIVWCIADEEKILKIYIWQLSNWGHLRQFGICFLKICRLSQFFLKECACEWANMHLRLKVIVWCIADEEKILKIYIWQLSNWGHLRQFGICFLTICWPSQFLLKGCAWEWTNMHLRLKVVVWCIVDEE